MIPSAPLEFANIPAAHYAENRVATTASPVNIVSPFSVSVPRFMADRRIYILIPVATGGTVFTIDGDIIFRLGGMTVLKVPFVSGLAFVSIRDRIFTPCKVNAGNPSCPDVLRVTIGAQTANVAPLHVWCFCDEISFEGTGNFSSGNLTQFLGVISQYAA